MGYTLIEVCGKRFSICMSKVELAIMRNNQMNILLEMLNTTKVIAVIKRCPTYTKYRGNGLTKHSIIGHSNSKNCSISRAEESLVEYAACKIIVKNELSRKIEKARNNTEKLVDTRSTWAACNLKDQIFQRCFPKSQGCFNLNLESEVDEILGSMDFGPSNYNCEEKQDFTFFVLATIFCFIVLALFLGFLLKDYLIIFVKRFRICDFWSGERPGVCPQDEFD